MSRLGDAWAVLRGAKQIGETAGPESIFARFGPNVGNLRRKGTAELLQAFSDAPWLHAVADKIAESVAATEWQLFRVPGRDRRLRRSLTRNSMTQVRHKRMATMLKQEEIEEVGEHPFFDFLDRGNGLFRGPQVRHVTQEHIDLAGEAFGLIEVNGLGTPVDWWPLPPTWVRETPRPGKPFEFKVSMGNTTETRVPGDQVLWFSKRDPADPYGRGVGTGRALGDEIDTDEYASKYSKQLFLNSAEPSHLISIENATDPQITEFSENWLRKLQGFWKVRQPHFINRKTEVQRLSDTMVDLQALELRKHERDTIVQVFSMPPEILGILADSNRATIDAAAYIFGLYVLHPRLEFARLTMQEGLLSKFDADDLVLDFVSPVEEDREHKRSVFASNAAAFKVDEIRALGGEDELPDEQGQVHLMNFNQVAVESPGDILDSGGDEPLDPAAPAPEPGSSSRFDESEAITPSQVLNGAQVQALLVLAQSVANGFSRESAIEIAIISFGLSRETAERIMPEQGEAGSEEEPQEERGLQARRHAQRALHELGLVKVDRGRAKAVDDDESITQVLEQLDAAPLADATAPVLTDIVTSFGEDQLQELEIGVDFDLTSPRVIEFLERNAARRIRDINRTTRRRLQATLRVGVQEGETTAQLAARVRSVFKNAQGPRSLLIARTETVRGAGFGAVEGMRQGGIDEKEWLDSRDSDVRESHVALNRQRVPVAGNFTSPISGATGPYPGELSGGAGENANCRCVPLAVVDERSIADTETKRDAYWKARESRRRPFERVLRRRLRKAFDQQQRAVLAALRRA